MATKVFESTVIKAPADKVWDAVRNLDFKWSKIVKSSDGEPGLVGSQRVITYTDGTVQKVTLSGLDDAKMSVTWDLVESDPPMQYLSCIHTIHLRRITNTNETYFEWVTDFSMDANQEVVQDCRYKRKEAFSDLASIFA
eukprot:TRINITY_DN1241_c0_g1_i7.p1 TRINITY_DN1241_c0_g1~~TRINITY_DN1241_c0_g1_i7.p1  ORF type:complete len:139 (+),score=45.54 TRINITY_DN1241_c0_g1_i7:55-471(+)